MPQKDSSRPASVFIGEEAAKIVTQYYGTFRGQHPIVAKLIPLSKRALKDQAPRNINCALLERGGVAKEGHTLGVMGRGKVLLRATVGGL